MRPSSSAFERVYADHVWSVFGFFSYRLRDRVLAEDLTQSTFERALRGWGRYDPRRASERTWLLVIARSVLIDHLRKHREEPVADTEQWVAAITPGPEQRYAGTDGLLRALGQLGEREREIIALRFGGDLSGPEIAELTGLTLANVQQILSRSLRRLRTLLEERQPAPEVE